MYICLCHGVSDKKLKELMENGVVSIRGLQKQCKVGADCGSCIFKVKELLEQNVTGCVTKGLPRASNE